MSLKVRKYNYKEKFSRRNCLKALISKVSDVYKLGMSNMCGYKSYIPDWDVRI